MVRYKNLLFRALLQRSHTKINLCNIPLSFRLLSDQNKKLLRRFFVKQDHPVQVLWIYLFFLFMGKCKKSTQCSEIVLCKALEYKVRPYGLLFSWYIYQKLFEGPEWEIVTLNQQMAPLFLHIWGQERHLE